MISSVDEIVKTYANRSKKLDDERRNKLINGYDDIMKKFADTSTDAEKFDQKPLFSNLHPASKVFNAIL